MPHDWQGVGPSDVILDCDVDSGYETYAWQTDQSSAVQLYLGAVYQTRSDHGSDHPLGEASVHFARLGASVLALSAYEPTHWTVTVGEGAALSKVIVIGYAAQSATVPDGVAVEAHFYEGGDGLAACGYSLPYNGGGCDTDELVADVEALSGLSLFRFDSCYDARTFDYAP